VDPRIRLGEGRAGRRRQAGRPDRLADAEPGPDGEADTVLDSDACADHDADADTDHGGDSHVDAHSDPVVDAHSDPVVLAVAEPDRHTAADPPADRVSDAGTHSHADDDLDGSDRTGADTDPHHGAVAEPVTLAEPVAHGLSRTNTVGGLRAMA
jgi:hypothetical protein